MWLGLEQGRGVELISRRCLQESCREVLTNDDLRMSIGEDLGFIYR